MLKRGWLALAGLGLFLSFQVSATKYVPIFIDDFVIIIPIDEAPIASSDTYIVVEDTLTVLEVLSNDVDENIATATIDIVTGSIAGASLNVNSVNNTISYITAPNGTAADNFSYRVVDENGNVSETVSVSISVTPVNDAPVASPIQLEMTELGTAFIDANNNQYISDVESDALTFEFVAPTDNSVTLSAAAGNSVINISGGHGFDGQTQFSYRVSDSVGAFSAWSTVTVNVINTNDAPAPLSGSPLTFSTQEGASINIDVSQLVYEPDSGQAAPLFSTGSVTVSSGQGSISSQSTTDFTYSAPVGFGGTAQVQFTAVDIHGYIYNGVVNIHVQDVNFAPVTVADAAISTDEDVAVTSGNLVANDTDIDGDSLFILGNSLNTSGGTASVVGGTTIQFTPPLDASGTFTVDYSVTDGKGGLSAAQLTVNVNATNDAPVAKPITLQFNELGSTTLYANGNSAITDVDGDSLSIDVPNIPENTYFEGGLYRQYIYIVREDDNSRIRFTGAAGYDGTMEFRYRARDASGAYSNYSTITINVINISDPPVPVAGSPLTYNVNEGNTIRIYANNLAADPDERGSVFFRKDLVSVTQGTGQVTPGSSGSTFEWFDFTATEGFSGTVEVTFTLQDIYADVYTGVLYINVNDVNQSPVFNADTALNTAEDTTVTSGNLLANDTDADGDALSIMPGYVVPDAGTASIVNGNAIQFTPPANASGTYTIAYVITDNNQGTTNGQLNVHVSAVNDAPVINNNHSPQTTVSAGNVFSFSPDVSDVDDTSLTYSVTQLPGWLNFNSTNGTISGTPDNTHVGNYSNIQLTVSDGELSDSLTFSVEVKRVNNIPVAQEVNTSTPEDTALPVTLTATDADSDALTYTLVDSASNGTVSLSGNVATYTPELNFTGVDSFTFAASDAEDTSVTTPVTINVTPVNDAPVFTNSPATAVMVDAAYSFVPAVTDIDSPSYTFSAQNLPTWLSFNATNGQLSGTPALANAGAHSGITLTVTDDQNKSTDLAFDLSVNRINSAPEASPVTASTNEDTQKVITLLGTDPEGDALTWQVTSAPANGTFTISGNQLTYTPTANFHGSDTFRYTVSDNTLTSAESTVTVTVTPQNDPVEGVPVINGTHTVNSTLTVDITGISDIDDLGTFSYQWLRDGVAISGQTNSTYVVSVSDQLKALTVSVSYTDGDDTQESTTSEAVTIDALPAPTVSISNMTDFSVLTVDGLFVQANTSDSSRTKDVQFSIDNGTTWYADADGQAPWQHDFGLQNSGTYTVQARAISLVDEISQVDSVNVTLKLTTPNLVVENLVSEYTYDVYWDTITGATYYELQEKVDGGTWGSANYAETRINYSNQPIGTYEYRVRACDSGGCGDFSPLQSKVVELTIGQCPVL